MFVLYTKLHFTFRIKWSFHQIFPLIDLIIKFLLVYSSILIKFGVKAFTKLLLRPFTLVITKAELDLITGILFKDMFAHANNEIEEDRGFVSTNMHNNKFSEILFVTVVMCYTNSWGPTLFRTNQQTKSYFIHKHFIDGLTGVSLNSELFTGKLDIVLTDIFIEITFWNGLNSYVELIMLSFWWCFWNVLLYTDPIFNTSGTILFNLIFIFLTFWAVFFIAVIFNFFLWFRFRFF